MDLDDAYDNAGHIAGSDDYPPRWAAEAEAFRQQMGVIGRARLGLMYGHGTRAAFDLFLPDLTPKGLLIFVHGGYWRRFDRSLWSHFATGALGHEWAVAMPSYDLVPRVRISHITQQVAQAIGVIAQEVTGPIRLVGHSAGGHLVARMLAPEMLPADVAGRIEHAMAISAVSDLRPLCDLAMNADFRLDAAEAHAESPIFQPRPEAHHRRGQAPFRRDRRSAGPRQRHGPAAADALRTSSLHPRGKTHRPSCPASNSIVSLAPEAGRWRRPPWSSTPLFSPERRDLLS